MTIQGWPLIMDAAYILISVLDFWEHYGESNIRQYIYDTAKVAGKPLSFPHLVMSIPCMIEKGR